MFDQAKDIIRDEMDNIKNSGLWKQEREITGAQGVRIDVMGRKDVLNMCANNYLGLSNHPLIVEAAINSYQTWGYGMSSVRFICGTQQIHKQLENRLSEFLGTEDSILYSSCFDANGGLFETLLSERDAIISDELNHASIIDGIRLCKASRYRYRNNDMNDLEDQLKKAGGARLKMIATDGVFSMDGIIADLKGICRLAEMYDAIVMVDDSHAVGFIGENGRGTPEYCGVQDRVDILTGTFGKALGGASGGYTSGRKEIIDLLRQRSRPYLFSNSLAPSIAGATIKALELLASTSDLRDTLRSNTEYFRKKMSDAGFNIKEGVHPIVPVILGDAILAQKMAEKLFQNDVYVTAFFYPVVPVGKARIRAQISAMHTKKDLDKAIGAFIEAGKELAVI